MPRREPDVEYRGVRAWVEIVDSLDLDEYAVVMLWIEGDRVAVSDTQGQPYGPIYEKHIRAQPLTKEGD